MAADVAGSIVWPCIEEILWLILAYKVGNIFFIIIIDHS